jgi:glycerate kinase
MENKTEYTMIKELIAEENRKQVGKVLLGGAAVGIGGALSLVLFLNMLVAFDWISDAIVRIIGGL